MQRSPLFLLPVAVGALFAASPAAAQSRIYVPCPNGPPCSVNVPGYIDAVGTARLPWVISVAVPAGLCFRPMLSSADAGDARYVLRSVIAPNGIVYRNADANGIRIKDTIAGWYTIQFDSKPPWREQLVGANLVFLPGNDPNCSTATPGR
jgi:hypothetical protein